MLSIWHKFFLIFEAKTWMAGTSPAMTAFIEKIGVQTFIRGGLFASAAAIAEISGLMKKASLSG